GFHNGVYRRFIWGYRYRATGQ
ncbi:hypothetical protein D041_0592B, partial [Vibrio parahaemolyticus EKP-008]